MEGLEKKPARPAPRNPQAGRLGESRLSPGDAGLAEAEFDAEGSLREFPFLEDRVAAEDAAGAAFKAAGAVKADRAVVGLFIEIGRASLHELAEFFAVGLIAEHDVRIFLIHKELVFTELFVHVDELNFLRAHSAFPQP